MGEIFERFKLGLHNRIKQGTKEINFDNGERVLMKYGGFHFWFIDLRDWHVIYPPVIEENGKLKILWTNFIFGGKRNIWKLLGIIGIAALLYFSVADLFHQYSVLYAKCYPNIVPINFTGLK